MNYSGIEHRHQIVTMPRKMDDVILARSTPWERDLKCDPRAMEVYIMLACAGGLVIGMTVIGWVGHKLYKAVWPWISVKVLWIWNAGPLYAMRWIIVTVAVMFAYCCIMWAWQKHQNRKKAASGLR